MALNDTATAANAKRISDHLDKAREFIYEARRAIGKAQLLIDGEDTAESLSLARGHNQVQQAGALRLVQEDLIRDINRWEGYLSFRKSEEERK